MRRLPLPPLVLLPSVVLLPSIVLLMATVLAVAAAALTAAPAWAHTRLVSSTPAQGQPAEAPAQVVLVFSDPVQAGLSALSVRDDDGVEHVAGSPAPGGDDASVAQALRAPLEPGTYTVAYRVLAGDGHPVTGSFEITTVASSTTAPAAPTAAPTAAAPTPVPTTATTTEALSPTAGSSEDEGLPVLPLVVGGLVVAGAGGLLARRLGGGARPSS